ncbi:MAG: response regulator transcription factor [Anaerolineae bacterium]|nr:response regulator transcription factor [Anaerolineae bacterium]RIK20437.1 MAG: hypothetical protein DCC53_10595 [Chloroflexota bacterium]
MTTWMIVEDDPNLYELMCEAFERWEIETLLFVEVEEALEWIDLVDQGHNVGELPELAMLDLLFHRVKLGHLVGQRLRASPVLNRLPIVIMSAHRETPAEREDYRKTFQPDDYIRKPLPRWGELKRRLDAVVTKRKRQNALARVPRAPKA